MRRSADFDQGHRWKIFGIFILIPGRRSDSAVDHWPHRRGRRGAITFATDGVIALVLAGLLGLIGAAVYTAYLNIVLVMFYHDLRVTKEGVDTDQCAAVFD